MAKSDLSDLGCALAVIAVLGLLLLIFGKSVNEGFGSDTIPCGVDHAPCSVGLKCINGFCANTTPLPTHEVDPVPILDGPAPYTA